MAAVYRIALNFGFSIPANKGSHVVVLNSLDVVMMSAVYALKCLRRFFKRCSNAEIFLNVTKSPGYLKIASLQCPIQSSVNIV